MELEPIVIFGPCGAGKSTLVDQIKSEYPEYTHIDVAEYLRWDPVEEQLTNSQELISANNRIVDHANEHGPGPYIYEIANAIPRHTIGGLALQLGVNNFICFHATHIDYNSSPHDKLEAVKERTQSRPSNLPTFLPLAQITKPNFDPRIYTDKYSLIRTHISKQSARNQVLGQLDCFLGDCHG